MRAPDRAMHDQQNIWKKPMNIPSLRNVLADTLQPWQQWDWQSVFQGKVHMSQQCRCESRPKAHWNRCHAADEQKGKKGGGGGRGKGVEHQPNLTNLCTNIAWFSPIASSKLCHGCTSDDHIQWQEQTHAQQREEYWKKPGINMWQHPGQLWRSQWDLRQKVPPSVAEIRADHAQCLLLSQTQFTLCMSKMQDVAWK